MSAHFARGFRPFGVFGFGVRGFGVLGFGVLGFGVFGFGVRGIVRWAGRSGTGFERPDVPLAAPAHSITHHAPLPRPPTAPRTVAATTSSP